MRGSPSGSRAPPPETTSPGARPGIPVTSSTMLRNAEAPSVGQTGHKRSRATSALRPRFQKDRHRTPTALRAGAFLAHGQPLPPDKARWMRLHFPDGSALPRSRMNSRRSPNRRRLMASSRSAPRKLRGRRTEGTVADNRPIRANDQQGPPVPKGPITGIQLARPLRAWRRALPFFDNSLPERCRNRALLGQELLSLAFSAPVSQPLASEKSIPPYLAFQL